MRQFSAPRRMQSLVAEVTRLLAIPRMHIGAPEFWRSPLRGCDVIFGGLFMRRFFCRATKHKNRGAPVAMCSLPVAGKSLVRPFVAGSAARYGVIFKGEAIMGISKTFYGPCILLAALCLSGCYTFKLGGDKPLVDVDVGSGGGRDSSYEVTDNDYGRRYLEVTDLNAKRSYDGDDLNATITGRIKNKGKRTVTYVKATFLFLNRSDRLVDDKNEKILEGNLEPGETRRFKADVDDIKEGWSGDVPEVQLKKVKIRRD